MKKIKAFVSKVDTVDVVLMSALGLYLSLLVHAVLQITL
jgi:hypothetical protein